MDACEKVTGTPSGLIVGIVLQLDDEGVKAAAVGVTVSPTVYETGVPFEV